MNYSIKNDIIEAYNNTESFSFPKYTSQLINWANQNAQGTRSGVVGQMSELFPEFLRSTDEVSIENWKAWYLKRYPEAFEKATNKIYAQVQNLQKAITLIDREMVEKWVEDLVVFKTFNGLYVQKQFWHFLRRREAPHIAWLHLQKNLLELMVMWVMCHILLSQILTKQWDACRKLLMLR